SRPGGPGVKEARRIMGTEALIGVSTHDPEQLRRAVLDGAGYVSAGPTFPSSTKDFAEFPGLDYVRRTAAETTLPVFAVGGITADNVGEVIATGGRRIAVAAA